MSDGTRTPPTTRHWTRSRASATALATVVTVLLSLSPTPAAQDPGPDPRAYTGCYAVPNTGSADSLTVVSYNIQYGEDLVVALADLASSPRLREADVFLLQEMDPAGTDSLARSLRCDYVYYQASVSPHHDLPFGNAVLSRWPITAHRMLVLPHGTPFTGQKRIAVSADLDVAGHLVRAVSVHLATVVVPLPERLEQVAAVADSLASAAGPLVVAGDFNTVSDHEAARIRRTLYAPGLHEARLPDGHTMARSLLGLTTLDFDLDRLYYRDLNLTTTGISTTARASDHLPIWATFRLSSN